MLTQGKRPRGRQKNELNLRNACDDFGERKKKCIDATQWLWRPEGGAKTQKCIVRNGYGVQKERNNEGIETTQRLRRPEGAKNMNALKLRNGCGDQGKREKRIDVRLRSGCGDRVVLLVVVVVVCVGKGGEGGQKLIRYVKLRNGPCDQGSEK